MVIGTKPWKIKGFTRLAFYVTKQEGRIPPENDFTICHNLREGSLEEIIDQFEDNATYCKARKGGNYLIHEWLSFGKDDRHAITPDMLRDLTEKYLSLRAPMGVALAKPHYDRDHVHVHVMLAANEYHSPKKLRLDSTQFIGVRRDLEAFQLEKYPELEHSGVYIGSLEKRREHQQQRAADVVRECLNQARTEGHFLDLLRIRGAEPYERGGKVVGIIHHHKKHRFSTLAKNYGLDLAVLRERERRRQELGRLHEEKERRRSKDKDRGRDR